MQAFQGPDEVSENPKFHNQQLFPSETEVHQQIWQMSHNFHSIESFLILMYDHIADSDINKAHRSRIFGGWETIKELLTQALNEDTA